MEEDQKILIYNELRLTTGIKHHWGLSSKSVKTDRWTAPSLIADIDNVNIMLYIY